MGSAQRPEKAQLERLGLLVALGKNSAFGREHGFSKIDSYRSFSDRVPVRGYEEFSAWIERICDGEKAVLSSAPVKLVEVSSGTSSTNKYIPYTQTLLDEFAAATSPWIYDLYTALDGLKGTTSYWSISPVMAERRTTRGGVPIGAMDDTEYFGPLQRFALRKMMAVPGSVARISDPEEWRLATLRHLLLAEDLGFISVWSPTFLSLLMKSLESHLDSLLETLPRPRQRSVRAALESGADGVGVERIWPRLKAISCWTDGWARHHLPELRRWFPTTLVQPKGLLATEGVVSFPLMGRSGSVLAVGGHFLEFIDLDHSGAAPLLAHELRPGGSYSPLLTTGGGLYRYHLKDVIRCVGTYLRTPLIVFEGKLDAVSDVCGEKLSAPQVERAMEVAKQGTGLDYTFAMVSPSSGAERGYRLFLETDCDDSVVTSAVARLEAELRRGHHYDYCRKLGQLEPLRAVRVKSGSERYTQAAMARGQRAGSLKPQLLDTLALADHAFSHGQAKEPSSALRKEHSL